MALETVLARPSASVIVVRDAREGLETFMVRRHARSPAFPSAYVFPGGTVRADDVEVQAPDPVVLAQRLTERSDSAVTSAEAAELHVCAIREVFEEAGILCARDTSARLLTVDPSDVPLQERLESTRLALQARDVSLARVLGEWELTPAFDLLVPFSHWVTPTGLAARFDTWFFVLAMPSGQTALHDTIETSDGVWLRPAAVLEGEYQIVWATDQHLRRLSSFSSVAHLLAFSTTKRILRVQPSRVEGPDGATITVDPHLVDAW